MPKYDPNFFREEFPNLFKEIEGGEGVSVDGVRTSTEEGEKAVEVDQGSGPNIIDFIRLCDTEDEAIEIINYMQKEGKVEGNHGRKLRNQLIHKGLRSFGSKRDPGKYSYTE